MLGCQQGDTLRREGEDLDADGMLGGGEITEDRSQGAVRRGLVIAVAHHHDAPGLAGAPAYESDYVERCLVGPMGVLDDEDRRMSQFVEQTGHQQMPASGLGGFGQPAAHIVGYVEHWSQRSGSGQRIAGSSEDGEPRSQTVEKRIDQGRLSGARFAGDENDRPLPGDGSTTEIVKPSQQVVPLHQHGERRYRPR